MTLGSDLVEVKVTTRSGSFASVVADRYSDLAHWRNAADRVAAGKTGVVYLICNPMDQEALIARLNNDDDVIRYIVR